MRIGIDGNEANIKKRVGSNIYAFRLLKEIKKIDKQNFFSIYLKSNPLPDLPQAGANWEYRVLKPSWFWTRWRLPLDLYFHQPGLNVFFTPGHYAPKHCPVPLAISIMDLSFIHFPDMFKKRDLYKLVNWTKQSIIKANHIFTISEFSKNDIIQHYQIPENKITVTYPGFDKKRFTDNISTQEIARVKNKLGLKGEYILYLGTLQPRKNITNLIQAFAKLKNKKLKLVIAGKKGWHYQHILNQGKALDIEKKVIFTGFIDDNDLPGLLKGAKSLVLVSLYEGFGMPVVQAMSIGTPVVVADVSSLPEIVNKSGILVNPTSVKSITRGLNQALQLNKVQRNELIVKNKKILKKFSWKKAAEKTLEVLYALAI